METPRSTDTEAQDVERGHDEQRYEPERDERPDEVADPTDAEGEPEA